MTPEFWHGKRVLMTGHTGFKGAWLSLWLQKLGASVTGYALPPPTQPSLFALADVASSIMHIEGDVRDLQHFSSVMQSSEPDIVLHLAAQSLVRPSYQDPVSTYATNVMGTVHVLEAIKHTPSVKTAVIVTSDKCYENKEQLWGYRENDPMGGNDPYSNSKGCAELVTHAYRTSFMHAVNAPAVATARAGNVIGGGDWALDRLVPDIIQSLHTQSAVTLRYPNAIRPWQHVLEPLAGYLRLAEALFNHGASYAEAWNFGPHEDDARSVLWMTQSLFRAWGSQENIQVENAQLHEAGLLKLDCSKAKARLDWHPQWRAETALNKVCEWYQAYFDHQDMRTYTLKQITEFETCLLQTAN